MKNLTSTQLWSVGMNAVCESITESLGDTVFHLSEGGGTQLIRVICCHYSRTV